jgi:class 3 adenylate cyclase/DNA-binding winged helix-turn-helix (wHTH) protein
MRYCFADCILDTQLYTLSRAGTTRLLRPKVFQVLQYLLAHRDQVVSKEELCAQVWPDQFISDTTLESCIKQTRQAIGDSGQAQQLIQTRRGYGYRFIGAVEEQPEARPAQESAAAVPTSPATPPQDDMPRRPAPARLPGEDPVASGAGAASPALRSSLSPRAAHERSGQGVPDGERKLVTLLGCTLAHASALRARCGLDALHSRMRTLYTLMQQEVHQYGGTIHHVAGERLLAVFGAPVAQEDHARRAVLAACGLLQRLAACRDPAGAPTEEPLAVCLGLHTGMIVVGGIGEASEPAAVVGDLTLVVEALQAHAAPGALLCSEATARLIQGEVRLKAHRPVPVPGPPTPLQAYQVLGVHPREHPAVRRMGRVESPFIGRTQALAALHALLAQVEEGRGQVVGVVGEPGIGKSRLLAEFHHSLQGRHLRCHYGRCLSYGQTTPYLPVLDLLRHFCGLTAADSPEGLTAKIHHKLREVGVAPEEAAVYLLALLGVETGTAELAALAPEVRKARTFATLVQCCIHGSQPCPLILAVEDLHWSDAISAEWLTALVERVGNVPLLVLGTYRPGYRPGWLEKSYATQVALQPLSPRDSRRMVQALLPMTQRPAVLERAILAKADGNPFFLEELVQTAMEQGGVRSCWASQTPSRRSWPPAWTDCPLRRSTSFRLLPSSVWRCPCRWCRP